MIFHSSQVVFCESFSVSITTNRRKRALFFVESSEWGNCQWISNHRQMSTSNALEILHNIQFEPLMPFYNAWYLEAPFVAILGIA
jgi:hypothetical protein